MLYDTFERVYIIDLPYRKERFDECFRKLSADWHFRRPEHYVAAELATFTIGRDAERKHWHVAMPTSRAPPPQRKKDDNLTN